jgi:Domain of unknown function (DUF4760)
MASAPGDSPPAWWKQDIQVRLPRIGLSGVVATAVLIIGYIAFPDARAILTFTLAALASLAALISAYYVGQGLRESAAEARRAAENAKKAAADAERGERFNRAMFYTGRWGDPQLATARTAFREILDGLHGDEDAGEKIREKVEQSRAVEASLIACMNLLEDLALAVHEDMVDEEIVYRYYNTTVRWCWETLGPWVKQVRQRRGPRIYTELEDLYNSWSQR